MNETHPFFARRMSRRQLVMLDAVAGVCAAFTFFTITVHVEAPAPWMRLALPLGLGLPLAMRRFLPLPVFCFTLVLAIFAALTGAAGLVYLAPAYALYIVALSDKLGAAVPSSAIAVVSLMTIVSVTVAGTPRDRAPDWLVHLDQPLLGIAALGGAWTIGRAVQERRSYAARDAERLAAQAVAEERLRIARELHDVVTHSVGLIAVKAGVANHVMATRPEEAHDALRVIETASRSALVEMRHLLGVLRSTAAPDRVPAPGLTGLEGLIRQARLAGVEVEFNLQVETGDESRVGAVPQEAATRQGAEVLRQMSAVSQAEAARGSAEGQTDAVPGRTATGQAEACPGVATGQADACAGGAVCGQVEVFSGDAVPVKEEALREGTARGRVEAARGEAASHGSKAQATQTELTLGEAEVLQGGTVRGGVRALRGGVAQGDVETSQGGTVQGGVEALPDGAALGSIKALRGGASRDGVAAMQGGMAQGGMARGGMARGGMARGGVEAGPYGAARGSAGALPGDAAQGRPEALREGGRSLGDAVPRAGVTGSEWEAEAWGRLPDGVGLAVHRIVQEALTNVVKHAAPTRCSVVVALDAEEVRIEVVDDGPGRRTSTGGSGRRTPGDGAGWRTSGDGPGWRTSGDGAGERAVPGEGPGHGLIGMRERVMMYGGVFEAGSLPGRGFRVFAKLPYEEVS
ncbi:sensor histidine kinase [[Actinomadura] parvosata]|uniref:sensor histidine kinase n=1 Tax=[Actinomadura] parvosata TaxID=1955412 RepID=UPI00406C930C